MIFRKLASAFLPQMVQSPAMILHRNVAVSHGTQRHQMSDSSAPDASSRQRHVSWAGAPRPHTDNAAVAQDDQQREVFDDQATVPSGPVVWPAASYLSPVHTPPVFGRDEACQEAAPAAVPAQPGHNGPQPAAAVGEAAGLSASTSSPGKIAAAAPPDALEHASKPEAPAARRRKEPQAAKKKGWDDRTQTMSILPKRILQPAPTHQVRRLPPRVLLVLSVMLCAFTVSNEPCVEPHVGKLMIVTAPLS